MGVQSFLTKTAVFIVILAAAMNQIPSRIPDAYQGYMDDAATAVFKLAKFKKALHHVNERGTWRPLSIAAAIPNETAIRYLVDYFGVDVNAQDSTGSTALHYAAAKTNSWAVQALLDTGKVDLDIKDNEGRTALDLVVDLPIFATSKRLTARILIYYTYRQRIQPRVDKAIKEGREMQVKQVDRVHVKDLSFQKFFDNYEKTRRPVIIEGMQERTINQTWDFDLLKKYCGEGKVRLKTHNKNSQTWGRLVTDETPTKIEDFLVGLETEDPFYTKRYWFDVSVEKSGVCGALGNETFSMPHYFANDYLNMMPKNSNHRGAIRYNWPSLIVGYKGTKTAMHIDALGSSFWMLLTVGAKKWRFFDTPEIPLLYPRVRRQTFDVDGLDIDYEKHPMMRLATAHECILKAGDLLFVPAGSPHAVWNLETSIGIAGNYIDKANLDIALPELYHEAHMNNARRFEYTLMHLLHNNSAPMDMNPKDVPWKELIEKKFPKLAEDFFDDLFKGVDEKLDERLEEFNLTKNGTTEDEQNKYRTFRYRFGMAHLANYSLYPMQKDYQLRLLEDLPPLSKN